MRNNVATLTLTTMPSPGGVVIGNNRDDEDETMTPTGGIDMNSANMALVIKRDGKGVPLPLAQQDRAQLSRISGFVPHIIEIKPITSLAAFSRLRE